MRLFLLLCCILASIFVYSDAFVQPTKFRARVKDTITTNFQQPLISLTSTSSSSLQSPSLLKLSPWDKEDDNVNVQELEVDAFTLTWYVYRISKDTIYCLYSMYVIYCFISHMFALCIVISLLQCWVWINRI